MDFLYIYDFGLWFYMVWLLGSKKKSIVVYSSHLIFDDIRYPFNFQFLDNDIIYPAYVKIKSVDTEAFIL